MADELKVQRGKDQFIVDPGTGEILRYDNSLSLVTEDNFKRAQEITDEIVEHTESIELHYLKLARTLSIFDSEQLYLALNYGSFREWAQSNEIPGLSYRTAHNLLRIANEIIPVLTAHNALDKLPPVSTMYDLLPILSDDNSEQKILDAIDRVQGLTTRDAKREIREVRGLSNDINETLPTIFKGRVTLGESHHKVEIYCSTGDSYYHCGNIVIKPEHFKYWEERFGRFLDIL